MYTKFDKPLYKIYANKRIAIIIITVSICLALISVFFAFLITQRSNEKRDIAQYIYNEYSMGEAYYKWQQSLQSGEFEDSKEAWDEVQKDWEALGIKVSWDYVSEVYEESLSEGVPFHTYFRRSFNEDFCKVQNDGTMLCLWIALISVIVAVYSICRLKDTENFQTPYRFEEKQTHATAYTPEMQKSVNIVLSSHTLNSSNRMVSDDALTRETESEDFDIEDGLLFRYKGKRKNVTIPTGVREICPRAFEGMEIEKVTIPTGIKKIGDKAFSNCKNLEWVDLPDTLVSIGDDAFWSCYKLSHIDIPESVTSLGKMAFYSCPLMPSLRIPNNITQIKFGLFLSCEQVETVSLPKQLESIENDAFCYCSKLSSLTIPETVKRIDSTAFDHCENLEVIYYPGTEEQARKIGLMDLKGCHAFIRYNWHGDKK